MGIEVTDIRERTEVVGPDGEHIGVVDKVEGSRLKLTKGNSHSGLHHDVDLAEIDAIEERCVRLSRKAAHTIMGQD